ncbi:hypothetical protein IGI37_000156 [Enterococcus sp. AZ194]|uniref:threonine/serine ThrE exporter family protein n=1 Tax=Enterococcus sp. AZ194 TaxID=2774629 RepID=UPI003F233433
MNEKELFNLVFDFGETLLINGGEIKRVELMVSLLGDYFQLQNFNSFVMINGLFLTAETEEGLLSSKVKDISVGAINLGRIDRINTLSRQVCQGEITSETAKNELQRIKTENNSSPALKFFAYCFGSASFCYIFGGTFLDSIGALFLGGLIAVCQLLLIPRLKLSTIVSQIGSSFFMTGTAILLTLVFSNLNVNSLIIGGVISLVPGVPLANGIRYLFDEDYTSGWAQLMTALMTALYLSVGVGAGLQMFHMMIGAL